MRRRLLIWAAAGAGVVALIGLAGTLLADEPRLSVSDLGPWIVLWGIGLFGLLLFAPFAIHAKLAARSEDPDRRWELAVVVWGGAALAGVACFGAISLASGFDTGAAVGALVLVGLLECGLVAAAVGLMMLTGG